MDPRAPEASARADGRSLEDFDDAPDELAQEQPVLASCYAASLGDRQLLGEAPGQRTRKLVEPVDETSRPNEALADEPAGDGPDDDDDDVWEDVVDAG